MCSNSWRCISRSPEGSCGANARADRTYRLSRILAAEALAEPAERPDRVDLCRVWRERSTQLRAGEDQVDVAVRTLPARLDELAGTAVAVHAECIDPDGWLRLEVGFQDARHAEWALWQLATDAEALGPPWLRDALRDLADEAEARALE